MADQKQLTLLKQGGEIWNRWRQEHIDIQPNLHKADLGGAMLVGANLSGADLGGAMLVGADLRGAMLVGANLSGADLREANLSSAIFLSADLSRAMLAGAIFKIEGIHPAHLIRANLESADLSKTDLREMNLAHTNLKKANLIGADLTEAYLTGTDFSEADLSWAKLYRANLDGAKFHRAKLKGANLNRASLVDADLKQACLDEANLRGAALSGAVLCESHLYRADLQGAKLNRANLERSTIIDGTFTEANLVEANLTEAMLETTSFNRADLSCAQLIRADLTAADLTNTNLTGANLTEANLIYSRLVETNLEDADLTNCRIYGISAWNLQINVSTKQGSLVITRVKEPTITVENLEVAQFIYLLLNNPKIRDVIDTIARKAVLILGRFTPERKAILEAIKDALREHSYLPILFDFDKPNSQDLTETVMTLAHLSRFIIADLTDPGSIPYELHAIVPNRMVPVLPMLKESIDPITGIPIREFALFGDLRRKYHWVLPIYIYHDLQNLLASLETQIIGPAEQKAQKLAGLDPDHGSSESHTLAP